MKNLKLIPLFLTVLFFLSCSEEDPIIEYVTLTETVIETETETVEVDPFADSTLEGNITSDTTLDASKIWLLKGRVSVETGATLTIPAGTIIKAASGTGSDASTLIIARGAKIVANGTSAAPIVFTSQAGKTSEELMNYLNRNKPGSDVERDPFRNDPVNPNARRLGE